MPLSCRRRGDRPPAVGVEASLSGEVLLVGFLVGESLVGGERGPTKNIHNYFTIMTDSIMIIFSQIIQVVDPCISIFGKLSAWEPVPISKM